MSEPLQRVLGATEPLTLAGVPSGFLPWLAADLARAAFGSGKARAVVIAADEASMRALADTAPLFAPDVCMRRCTPSFSMSPVKPKPSISTPIDPTMLARST